MPPIRTAEGGVLNWASDIDPRALEQAERTSRLSFVPGPVALMPDAHVGKGSTIGSVIPTQGAIIPSAIGVDIGCGMIAVELDLTSEDLPDDLSELHDRIAHSVPAGVGRGHRTSPGHTPREDSFHKFLHRTSAVPLSQREEETAFSQYGSLGSGNHFVEICLDERDRVWVVLHSGSRGVGNRLAQAHIEKAKGLMAEYFIELEDPDLAYLVEGTDEFEAYIAHMLWAQDYAAANRDMMLDLVLTEMAVYLHAEGTASFSGTDRVNCHHNFTQQEHHLGRNVWLTRKGAIRAREGDRGIIPGSMGTSTYIVTGLGNESSYCSCSHGAGRRMSRSKARKTLDIETLRTQMAGKSWDSDQATKLIDEDPRSYKDIDRVMADQADLVRIDHTLTQILNYKGT